MPDIDWEKIKTAYHNSERRVVDICAAYNIKPHQLYRKMRVEHWTRRRTGRHKRDLTGRQQDIKQEEGAKQKKRKPRAGQMKARSCKSGTLGRDMAQLETLYELVEMMTKELLSRLQQRDHNDNATERARDTKTLSDLVQTIDRIRQLKDKQCEQRGQKGVPNRTRGGHSLFDGQLSDKQLDTPETRAALAARLEKLIKKL